MKDSKKNSHSVPGAGAQPGVLWSLAFRPFFLAAALWALLALVLWVVLLMTGATLPSRFDPLSWHIHAMLFGFVLAAIAGFMLTAIPTWTGRPPIHGAALAWLAALWLLGRIAGLVSAFLPLWLAAAVDLAFPFALCAVAAREVIAARNWRNLMMPVPIAILAVADLLMYLELAGVHLPGPIPTGLGWRLALAAIIALLSAVGSRIIPAFTRNWLLGRRATALPAAHDLIDSIGLATLHTGLLGWAFFPTSRLVGALLLLGAALNLWRLVRWRGAATLSEPLLTVLHLGYLWVVIGAGLLGGSVLNPQIPQSAAIHALTAGAIGTMVLAVMTRVARGHTGRPLAADQVTTAIYAIIIAAAVTRVLAAFAGNSLLLLGLSALFWVAGFGLFILAYRKALLLPRVERT